MNNPTTPLQLQHQSITNRLNTLGIMLSTDPEPTPWWEFLRGVKALHEDCVSHSSLILEYQEELGPTHWILDKIFTLILAKASDAEHLAIAMNRMARRILSYPDQMDETIARAELTESIQRMRKVFELEESIAYSMLNVLKCEPEISPPESQDAAYKPGLHLLNQ